MSFFSTKSCRSRGLKLSPSFYLPETFSMLTQKLRPSRNERSGKKPNVHEFPWHAVTF
jgi:hypothetical protein